MEGYLERMEYIDDKIKDRVFGSIGPERDLDAKTGQEQRQTRTKVGDAKPRV
jgi:hypothetical protein